MLVSETAALPLQKAKKSKQLVGPADFTVAVVRTGSDAIGCCSDALFVPLPSRHLCKDMHKI
jgi:hypothetical protein